jgi:hypothetical protein
MIEAIHGLRDAEVVDYRLKADSRWASSWKVAGAIGVAGLVVAGLEWMRDPSRFAFAYLFAYFVALSLALGNLFFVMLLYVTRATWGVTVRRVAELWMRPMPVFVLLALPLVASIPHLFPWAGAHSTASTAIPSSGQGRPSTPSKVQLVLDESRGAVEMEPVGLRHMPVVDRRRMETVERSSDTKIIDHKRPYLNTIFLLIRLALMLTIWQWLSARYFRWSTEQDKTRSPALTRSAQTFAPVGLILFGLTTTLFGVDWIMSLDATWSSTMFGVYVFAQCSLFQIAVLILTTLVLRRYGLLGEAVTVEHYHDMGKLLFGWISFWAYIAFSQFFLIWYSNLPEEVVWFHRRWDDYAGSWRGLSLALVAFHFVIPFWFLMSRNVKRRLPLLAAGAACVVMMHVVDVYWIVLPNVGMLAPKVVDVACLVGVFGMYLSAVLWGMRSVSLVAIGDPRLSRALQFENA